MVRKHRFDLSLVAGLCLAGSLVGCSGNGTDPMSSSPNLRTGGPGTTVAGGVKPNLVAPTLSTATTETLPVGSAIWVNSQAPGKSLLLATDGIETTGTVQAFDLDGKPAWKINNLNSPHGIDVQTGVKLGAESADIVAVAERSSSKVLFYKVNPVTGELEDISGRTDVFVGKEGEQKQVVGVSLYHRLDGKLFVFVTPKTSADLNGFAQYEAEFKDGKVDLQQVRYFGKVESKEHSAQILADDGLGFVYVLDGKLGVRKYQADPDAKDANRELGLFANMGFQGERSSLALFESDPKTGFLLISDKFAGGGKVAIFRREGGSANPHEHLPLAVVTTQGDAVTSLAATAFPLGTKFPNGMLTTLNGKSKSFELFDWGQIASQANIPASSR